MTETEVAETTAAVVGTSKQQGMMMSVALVVDELVLVLGLGHGPVPVPVPALVFSAAAPLLLEAVVAAAKMSYDSRMFEEAVVVAT